MHPARTARLLNISAVPRSDVQRPKRLALVVALVLASAPSPVGAQAPPPARVASRSLMVDLAMGRASVVDVAGDAVASWGKSFFGNSSSALTTSFGLVASDCNAIFPNPSGPTMWEAVEIAAGTTHTLVRFADGTVAGFGSNYWHQLGSPCPNGCYPSPEFPASTTAIPGLSGVGEIVDIAAGGDYSCVVGADGRGHCWGADGYGALGNGYSYGSRTKFVMASKVGPVLQSSTGACNTNLPAADGIAAIDAGERFACARLTDGTVKCWGQNSDAQLGLGALGAAIVPCATTVVVRDDAAPLTDVVDVQAGSAHACAIDANGAAWCWGGNGSRQLGNPLFTAAKVPYAVRVRCDTGSDQPTNCDNNGELINVVTLDAGHTHSCATHSDGELTCWGTGGHAELGISSSVTYSAGAVHSQSAAPALGWRSAHAGRFSSCAVDDLGRIRCWGSTYASIAGPIGTPDVTTPLSPPVPYPRAEICDGIDNDGDGATDESCDDDADGACDIEMITVASSDACPAGPGDCDDQDATISPAAYDWCGDETDTNCNGIVDDACSAPPCETHADCPSEGYCDNGTCKPDHPDGTCCAEAETCEGGYCASGVCCNSPTGCAPPSAVDDTCDGQDDNCNGQTDEDYAIISCGMGECAAESKCVFGHEVPCTAGIPGTESRDGLDNDCNGTTDDGFPPDVAAPTWPTGARFRLIRVVDGEVQLSWDPAIDDVRTANYTVSVTVDGTPIGQRSSPGSLFSLVRIPLPTMSNLATISATVVACDTSNNCGPPLVQTTPYCPEGATDCCRRDGDCDDAVADTIDRCESAVCVHETNPLYCANSAACDDADDCTFDTCLDNSCVNAEYAYCCTQATGCLVSPQALVIDPDEWFFRYDNDGNVLSMSGGELNIEQLAQDIIDADNAPDFVRQVLQDNQLLLGIDHRWLETARVDSIGSGEHPSFIVRFRQRYDGMEVEGGEVLAAVSDGKLGMILRSSAAPFVVSPRTTLTEADVVDAAIRLGGGSSDSAWVAGLSRVVIRSPHDGPTVYWRALVGDGDATRLAFVDANNSGRIRTVSLQKDMFYATYRTRAESGDPDGDQEPFAHGLVRVWAAAFPGYPEDQTNQVSGYFDALGNFAPTMPMPHQDPSSKAVWAVEAGLTGKFASIRSAVAQPGCPDWSWRLALCQGHFNSPLAPICAQLLKKCALLSNVSTDLSLTTPLLLNSRITEPHPFGHFEAAAGQFSFTLNALDAANSPADASIDRTHSMAYRAMNIAHAYFNHDCDQVHFQRRDSSDVQYLPLKPPKRAVTEITEPTSCSFGAIGALPRAFFAPDTWVAVPVVASQPVGIDEPPASYSAGASAVDWLGTDWGANIVYSGVATLGQFPPPGVPQLNRVGAINVASATSAPGGSAQRFDPSSSIFHEYGHLVRRVLAGGSGDADLGGPDLGMAGGMGEFFAEWFADVISGGTEAQVLDDNQRFPQREACWPNGAELFEDFKGEIGAHSFGFVLETMANELVQLVMARKGKVLSEAVALVARRYAYAMRVGTSDPQVLLLTLLYVDAVVSNLDPVGQPNLRTEICDAFNDHGVFIKECDGFTERPGLSIVSPTPGTGERVLAFNPFSAEARGLPAVLHPLDGNSHPTAVDVALQVGKCVDSESVDVQFKLRPKTPPGACPEQPLCGVCDVQDCAEADADETPQYLGTTAVITVPSSAANADQRANLNVADLLRLAPMFPTDTHPFVPNGVWELEIEMVCKNAAGLALQGRRRSLLFVRDDNHYDFWVREPIYLENSINVSDANKNGVFHVDGREGQLKCAQGVHVEGTGFNPYAAGDSRQFTFDAGTGVVIQDTEDGPGPGYRGVSNSTDPDAVAIGEPGVLDCHFAGFSTAIDVQWSSGPKKSVTIAGNTIVDAYATGDGIAAADCTTSHVKPIRVSAGSNELTNGATIEQNAIAGFHHFNSGRGISVAIKGEPKTGQLYIKENVIATWGAQAPQGLPTDLPHRHAKKGILLQASEAPVLISGNIIADVGESIDYTLTGDGDRSIEVVPRPYRPAASLLRISDNWVYGGRGISIGFRDNTFYAEPPPNGNPPVLIGGNRIGANGIGTSGRVFGPAIEIYGDNNGATTVRDNDISGADTGVRIRTSAGVTVDQNKFFGPITGACVEVSDLGLLAFEAESKRKQRTDKPSVLRGNWLPPLGVSGQPSPTGCPNMGLQLTDVFGELQIRDNRIAIPGEGINIVRPGGHIWIEGNYVRTLLAPALRVAGDTGSDASEVHLGRFPSQTSLQTQHFESNTGTVQVSNVRRFTVVDEQAFIGRGATPVISVTDVPMVEINSEYGKWSDPTNPDPSELFPFFHAGGSSVIEAQGGPCIAVARASVHARMSSWGVALRAAGLTEPWGNTQIAVQCSSQGPGFEFEDVHALEVKAGVESEAGLVCLSGSEVGSSSIDALDCSTSLDGVVLDQVDEVSITRLRVSGSGAPVRDGVALSHASTGSGAMTVSNSQIGDPSAPSSFIGTAISMSGPGTEARAEGNRIGSPSNATGVVAVGIAVHGFDSFALNDNEVGVSGQPWSPADPQSAGIGIDIGSTNSADDPAYQVQETATALWLGQSSCPDVLAGMPDCPARTINDNQISGFSLGIRVRNTACAVVDGGLIQAGSMGVQGTNTPRIGISGVTVAALPLDDPAVNITPGLNVARLAAVSLSGPATRGAYLVDNHVLDVATSQNPFWAFYHGLVLSDCFAPTVASNAIDDARLNLVWLEQVGCAYVVNNAFGLAGAAFLQCRDDGGEDNRWFDGPVSTSGATNIAGGTCYGGNYYGGAQESAICTAPPLGCAPGTFTTALAIPGTTGSADDWPLAKQPAGCP